MGIQESVQFGVEGPNYPWEVICVALIEPTTWKVAGVVSWTSRLYFKEFVDDTLYLLIILFVVL